MILKYVKSLLLIFLLIIGCRLSAQTHESPAHIRHAKELVKSITPFLEKEFNLECVGDGGSMPYNISSISISFVAKRRASIEEARELHIRCSEKLLKAINENEKIRPYLAEYPFSIDRADISIAFEAYYGPYTDGTISFVSQARNQIHYSKNDSLTGKLVDLLVEPYPEALKIVQKSLLSNVDLHSHKHKPYENELDTFLNSYAREVKSKWGIQCVAAGGEMSDGIKEFAFSFKRNKRTSIEEARKLEVEATDLLLSKINANEKLRPYLANYPFPVDKTKVKITFQKSDKEDFDDGSLYTVFQENNKIQYHAHDVFKEDAPTLYYPILIREESYDEALQILNPPTKK